MVVIVKKIHLRKKRLESRTAREWKNSMKEKEEKKNCNLKFRETKEIFFSHRVIYAVSNRWRPRQSCIWFLIKKSLSSCPSFIGFLSVSLIYNLYTYLLYLCFFLQSSAWPYLLFASQTLLWTTVEASSQTGRWHISSWFVCSRESLT